MFDLTGKVAVVTGSSRGIGAAIAMGLAQQGATVVINHRSSGEAAQQVAGQVAADGGTASVVQADVSDFEQAKQLVKATIDSYGQIDILVNNAGITRDKLLGMMKPEDWEIVLQTNLTSTFYCSKAAVRPMMKKRRGRIINITSVVGLAGQAGQTNYAASKAGLIGFTKSLAKEVGVRNITVNAIAPGFIPTAMTNDLSGDLMNTIIKETPLQRLGKPEEIAAAVVYLASDEAAFVTGQVLSVDGGLVMQ